MQTPDLVDSPHDTQGLLNRCAAAVRRQFDRAAGRIGNAAVVVGLGAVAGGAAFAQNAYLNWYSPIEIAIIRLEVTFSAHRFFALLSGATETARGREHILWSFVTFDVAFPLLYGPFLSVLYLWAERWRRFTPSGAPAAPDPPVPARHALFVLAPLAAAVLDVGVENVGLFLAGLLGSPSDLTTALVIVASTASVVKWLLLVLSAGAIACEVFQGPRGAVLWRARFSAIAAALGSIPLILIPQGQDILQRLFETEHPVVRLWITGVPPMIFGAFAVWYFARKLTELRLDDPKTAVRHGDWYAYFAEHIPRVLGAALLAAAGFAYAQVGSVGIYYGAAGVIGYFGVFYLRRFRPTLLKAVGDLLLPASWQTIPSLARELGGSVIAGVVTAVIPISSLFQSRVPTPFYHALAAALCLVSAWFFRLFVAFRRAVHNVRTSRAEQRLDDRPQANVVALEEISQGLQRAVLTASAVSVAFLVLFTLAPVHAGRWLGVLWVLALAVVNAAFVGSVSVWIGRRFHVPVGRIALLVALLFSIWNGDHDVRVMGSSAASRIAERPSIGQRFDRWLAAQPDTESVRRSVVLVAAAGGGLRAAYWTAMSLAVLADANPEFARHVFAVSGVSGGSLGGALFTTYVRDHADGPAWHCANPSSEGRHPDRTTRFYGTCVRDFMRDDFLSPVLAKLLAPDLLQWWLPFQVPPFDRSIGLEDSWAQSYYRVTDRWTLARGFLEWSDSAPSALPVLLFNSTSVETGRRYITSPVFKSVDADGGNRQFFDDAGDTLVTLQRDLSLASAVHNSARFTYVSPAGHLPSDDSSVHVDVVDGGYFENSGLTTLGEVYRELRKTEVSPYVLYLCNDPNTCGQPDPVLFAPTIADEVVAPIEALYNTRNARASLAEVALRREVGEDHFLQLNVCREPPGSMDSSSSDLARERVRQPPLGWVLSAMARNWMDRALDGSAAAPPSVGDPLPSPPDCYGDNANVIERLKNLIR